MSIGSSTVNWSPKYLISAQDKSAVYLIIKFGPQEVQIVRESNIMLYYEPEGITQKVLRIRHNTFYL